MKERGSNGERSPLEGLVGRLREYEGSDALGNGDFSLLREAADEIERLQYAQSWIRARSACNPTSKTLPGTFDSGYALALEHAAAAFHKTPNA